VIRSEENGIARKWHCKKMALQMHTAQCEMLLFLSKTVIGGLHNYFELAHLIKEKKEKHWPFTNFLSQCFSCH